MSLAEDWRRVKELKKTSEFYEMLHDTLFAIAQRHDRVGHKDVGSFILMNMERCASEIIEEHENLHGDNPTHQEMIEEMNRDADKRRIG